MLGEGGGGLVGGLVGIMGPSLMCHLSKIRSAPFQLMRLLIFIFIFVIDTKCNLVIEQCVHLLKTFCGKSEKPIVLPNAVN